MAPLIFPNHSPVPPSTQKSQLPPRPPPQASKSFPLSPNLRIRSPVTPLIALMHGAFCLMLPPSWPHHAHWTDGTSAAPQWGQGVRLSPLWARTSSPESREAVPRPPTPPHPHPGTPNHDVNHLGKTRDNYQLAQETSPRGYTANSSHTARVTCVREHFLGPRG